MKKIDWQKRVLKCEKNKKFVLPNICLKWKTKNNSYFYFPLKGILMNKYPNDLRNNEIYTAGSGYIRFVDFKYFKREELFRITSLELKKNRGKDKEIHSPSIITTYYITKDKTVFDFRGNQVYYSLKYWLKEVLKYNYNTEILEEFKKFIGNEVFYSSRGTKMNVNCIYNVSVWYELKDIYTANNLPTLKDNNLKKVLDFPLINMENKIKQYNPIKANYSWNYINYASFVEECNNFIVIRTFNLLSYQEDNRIYILNDKKTPIIIIRKIGDGWMLSNSIYKGWKRIRTRLENLENIKKTKLNWFVPMLEQEHIQPDNWVPYLLYIIKYPVIEKLYKAGYVNLAIKILRAETISSTLKDYFGEIDFKATNLFGILKCNKYQLELVENSLTKQKNAYLYSSTHSLIKRLKKFFNLSDIRNISNKDTDEAVEIITRFNYNYNYFIDSIKTLNINILTMKRLTKIVLKNSLKNKECNNSFPSFQLLIDTIRSYQCLTVANQNQINLFDNIEDYNDLCRLHNSIIELKLQEDQERRRVASLTEKERQKELLKKMEKVDKERRSYEKEGEDFSIILPKDIKDITQEGLCLHHCVGSYVNEHANGITTILFLRKNKNKNESFYTIEVKDNRVVQIHGLYNQWLGNNPEAILFVKQWCEEHDFKISETILRSTAKGYRNNNAPLAEIPAV